MESLRRLLNARSIRFLFILFVTVLVTLSIVLVSSLGLNFLPGTAVLAQTVPIHPLDALTAEEYALTKQLLTEAGYIDADSRFPLITLQEPAKAEVLAWQPSETIARSAAVVVKQGSQTYEAGVDLSAGTVQFWKEIEGVQPGVLLEEFIGVTELTVSNPEWQTAMQKRGITDFTQVFCAPLATGYYGLPEEEGRRILRVPCYDTRGTKNNLFGQPIEGVLAIVDLNEKQVLEVLDTELFPSVLIRLPMIKTQLANCVLLSILS